MRYFKLVDPKVEMIMDKVLFGVGGAAHLLPAVFAPITGFVVFAPVTIQMIVGALMLARLVDLFMK